MANVYMLFSEQLQFTEKHPHVNQKAWCAAVLQGFHGTQVLDELGIETSTLEQDVIDQWPDFEHEVRDSGVWLHSSDLADINHVAAFVQGYLRKFNPTGFFTLQWASTTSRPVLGGFGGGALVVTAQDIIQMSTTEAVEAIIECNLKPDTVPCNFNHDIDDNEGDVKS